jgi:hypothetical protein
MGQISMEISCPKGSVLGGYQQIGEAVEITVPS